MRHASKPLVQMGEKEREGAFDQIGKPIFLELLKQARKSAPGVPTSRFAVLVRGQELGERHRLFITREEGDGDGVACCHSIRAKDHAADPYVEVGVVEVGRPQLCVPAVMLLDPRGNGFARLGQVQVAMLVLIDGEAARVDAVRAVTGEDMREVAAAIEHGDGEGLGHMCNTQLSMQRLGLLRPDERTMVVVMTFDLDQGTYTPAGPT